MQHKRYLQHSCVASSWESEWASNAWRLHVVTFNLSILKDLHTLHCKFWYKYLRDTFFN